MISSPTSSPKRYFTALALLAMPCTALAWSPGVYTVPMESRDLSVNSQDRNDVVSFWHAIYQASEGYDKREIWKSHATPGYYAPDFAAAGPLYLKANGVPARGELNLYFVKDIERRVNYFRAMVGVPAGIEMMESDTQKNTSTVKMPTNNTVTDLLYNPLFTTLKADAAQASVYLMVRTRFDKNSTFGTVHNIPSSYVTNGSLSGFTNEAYNGNANSNLSIGFYGPGAIDAYLRDDVEGTGGWNTAVGHRRLTLAQSSTNFATGDLPGANINGTYRYSSNALYTLQRPAVTLLDQTIVPGEAAVGLAPRFTAYPPPGYLPAQLNSKFWSLSRVGANFSAATVSITDEQGNPVPLAATPVPSTSNGEPALVWQVTGDALAQSVSTDRKFNVTVSNIGTVIGGALTSYSYSVTLINPGLLTANQSMVGTIAPPAAGSANYYFTPPAGTEATEVNVFQSVPGTWKEDAETNSPGIIDRTYGNYDFRSGGIAGVGLVSGTKSFRLTHPVSYDPITSSVPDQIFEIDREIISGGTANSKLTFQFKRGYMISSATAVEASTDGGASWSTLGAVIPGVQNLVDATAQTWSQVLPPSNNPYRIRFRHYRLPGSIYTAESYPAYATGIFIDDITTTGCSVYELKKTNDVTGDGRFTFNAATSGDAALSTTSSYHLRIRNKLGNHWFPYALAKIVTPTSTPVQGFNGWFSYEYPVLTGGFAGDDDGDGEPNAIEYAFYADPLKAGKVPDSIAVSALAASGSSNERSVKALPVITISRPLSAARTGVTYGAEWSDNLSTWSSTGVTVSFGSGKVTASVAQGSGKRFLRWKIVSQ